MCGLQMTFQLHSAVWFHQRNKRKGPLDRGNNAKVQSYERGAAQHGWDRGWMEAEARQRFKGLSIRVQVQCRVWKVGSAPSPETCSPQISAWFLNIHQALPQYHLLTILAPASTIPGFSPPLPRANFSSWYLSRGFPDSSVGKESTCNAGDPGSIPGSGRSPGEGIGYPLQHYWASLVVQLVKNLPAMQETGVQSLGWEDPPEKGKATHSTILAWRILVAKSQTQLSNFHFHFSSTPTESQNLFTCLLVY